MLKIINGNIISKESNNMTDVTCYGADDTITYKSKYGGKPLKVSSGYILSIVWGTNARVYLQNSYDTSRANSNIIVYLGADRKDKYQGVVVQYTDNSGNVLDQKVDSTVPSKFSNGWINGAAKSYGYTRLDAMHIMLLNNKKLLSSDRSLHTLMLHSSMAKFDPSKISASSLNPPMIAIMPDDAEHVIVSGTAIQQTAAAALNRQIDVNNLGKAKLYATMCDILTFVNCQSVNNLLNPSKNASNVLKKQSEEFNSLDTSHFDGRMRQASLVGSATLNYLMENAKAFFTGYSDVLSNHTVSSQNVSITADVAGYLLKGFNLEGDGLKAVESLITSFASNATSLSESSSSDSTQQGALVTVFKYVNEINNEETGEYKPATGSIKFVYMEFTKVTSQWDNACSSGHVFNMNVNSVEFIGELNQDAVLGTYKNRYDWIVENAAAVMSSGKQYVPENSVIVSS